jgi:putative peptidoglycan lipid II flippase
VTAGNSITVAAWTIISRVTGIVRFAVIGAVLGPTLLGNTYQFTNSLPNLIYYGFLAGSLFSSLLVPALVRHIDAGDRAASERVAGGFLGMSLTVIAAVAPVAILAGPFVLGLAAAGTGSHHATSAQVRLGQLLILMFAPQILCYAVIGTATAVMNSRQRFALAAGAPAVENVATIAVLLAAARLYGTRASVTGVPTGELLLLGLGSTGAVLLHAATQWWGAKRVGVLLRPRRGWRDKEVLVVVRRAVPSLAQAGLLAVQVLILLGLANRLPGGIVAFQIGLNFYYLAIALGATPVALSLLPQLARLHLNGDTDRYRETLARGLSLGMFVTVPAAVGYLVLAGPLARAVSFGKMSGEGGVMVAVVLVALTPAVIGQTVFTIATYACYARKDTRSPLRSMLLQATVCLGLAGLAVFAHGTDVLLVLGLAMAAAVCVAACHLTIRVTKELGGGSRPRLLPALARYTAGAVIMAGPAWLAATWVPQLLGRPLGSRPGILAAAAVGAAIYLAVQAYWRSPELGWLTEGLRHARGKSARKSGGKSSQRPGDGAAAVTSPRAAWARRPARSRAALFPSRFPSRAAASSLSLYGSGVHGRSSRWLVVPSLAAAVGIGALAGRYPVPALLGAVVLAVAACVWARPALAAYLVITLTPVTVGISRGSAVPLRPNEAIALIVGGTLVVRGLVRMRTGEFNWRRLDQVEVAILAMAVCSSVVPLLTMAVRRVPITKDDVLYALVLWKLLGLYFLVRVSVTTQRQVRNCLRLTVGVGCLVAVLAILQSLQKFGVSHVLSHLYSTTANGAETGLQTGRGSSTLGLPAATADYMILSLAITAGLWTQASRRSRMVLAAAGLLFVMGTLAAGEFSSAIGLVIGIVCVAIVGRVPRLLTGFLPAAIVAGFALSPVIGRRLSGFQSASGLPVSWTTRLQNLQAYFWPKLFSDWNWVLGVRPSARIEVASQINGYVWIESGYTWLLWGGGIPLLASYLFFAYVMARRGWRAARGGSAAARVAGIAVFTMTFVVSALMIFDPHLTYRGSADALFFLLALTAARPAANARAKPQALSQPKRARQLPSDPEVAPYVPI